MKQPGVLCAAMIGAVLATPAWGCSICRCGDPTFNALGKEGVAQSGLRLAFDWDEVEKSAGEPAGDFSSLQEQRMTFLVAYGISDRFDVFARLPYSERDLTETVEGVSESSHTSGLADPEFYGQVRLWSSKFEGDVGMRSSVYAVFGVKTKWGENDATSGGERLDEHVQPGTGSTDWFAGLSGSYQVNPHSALFASAQYRETGRNDFGYRYGRITLFNVAYEHKLGARWDGVIEANYRHAGHDQIDTEATTDADSGGSIAYITPRILFDAGGGWVLRASAQIPLSDSSLYGRQDEKVVLNIGVTRLLKRN
ncbi:MAG: hypothetical protein ACREVZ_00410 [Burkholderiales bacterium]